MNIISHVYMLRCTTEVRSANRIVVEVGEDFLYRKNCIKIAVKYPLLLIQIVKDSGRRRRKRVVQSDLKEYSSKWKHRAIIYQNTTRYVHMRESLKNDDKSILSLATSSITDVVNLILMRMNKWKLLNISFSPSSGFKFKSKNQRKS